MAFVFRYLPYVSGAALGWLLVSPPAFLEPLGAARWLVGALLVAVLFVSLAAAQLLANLPASPEIRAADGALEASLAALCRQLQELGFRPIGTPLAVAVAPPAVLVAFVHEKERCYANAFQTTTVPRKTAFDFVSVLEGDRGGLTSLAEPAGAVLPASAGSMRQVFAGASVDEVFQRHLAALRFLSERGLAAREVGEATFRADFLASFRRQRAGFLRAPVSFTLLAIWRAATSRTPYAGPLASQAEALRTIREIQSGRTPRPG